VSEGRECGRRRCAVSTSGVACDLGNRSHGDIGGARYILAAHRTRGLGRNNSSVSRVCCSYSDSGAGHGRRACEERGSKG